MPDTLQESKMRLVKKGGDLIVGTIRLDELNVVN